MNNQSFYSYSFGCRVNEAEKEEIDRKMLRLGYRFDEANPNIFIINSCSVTNKAQREARQYIYQVKKLHPETKIVVTGCAATYWLKNSQTGKVPADLIVDNINKEYLVEIVKKRFLNPNEAKSKRGQLPISNKFMGSGRAMIKIQDGCQRFCSFCIVPYLRGVPRSTKITDIIDKVKSQLKSVQTKEVILTAINTQAFGYDSKESFIQLLEAVVDKTRVPRVSLGSVHPWSVDEKFFAFYRKYLPKKRLVNFFHIPLQSGSDKMLALMKRGYRREEFVAKLDELSSINPFALIATDIIVGFLEETKEDFQDTYDFLEKSPISKFHVFRYSKRAKTAADYMAKRLHEPTSNEKEARAEALIRLSREKLSRFMEKNVGRTSSILFLEKTEGDYREGLLDNQLPILIPSKKNNEAGTIKNSKIMEFKKGRLFGKIV